MIHQEKSVPHHRLTNVGDKLNLKRFQKFTISIIKI